MAVKVNEEYDKNGVLVDKQQAQIVESIRRRRERKVSLQSADEGDEAGEDAGATYDGGPAHHVHAVEVGREGEVAPQERPGQISLPPPDIADQPDAQGAAQ